MTTWNDMTTDERAAWALSAATDPLVVDAIHADRESSRPPVEYPTLEQVRSYLAEAHKWLDVEREKRADLIEQFEGYREEMRGYIAQQDERIADLANALTAACVLIEVQQGRPVWKRGRNALARSGADHA